MTQPRNQCMGCQAGWPRRPCDSRHPLSDRTISYVLHDVTGGYPGEIVMCTAERYQHKETP